MTDSRRRARGRVAAAGLATLMLVAGTAPASAAGWIDEAKLGVMAHDIPLGDHHVEPGIDLNGEVLFVSPGLLRAIGSPRPHFGVSVNTAGATSYAYGGLTWTFDFGDVAFLGLGLGGAVHDGEIDGRAIADRKRFGSRVLFHGGIELGYRVTRSLSVSILLDHMSNGNLARRNSGLTNIGLRTGFRF